MILYTFQSREKYEELQKNGFILGSPDGVVMGHWGTEFLDAYKYLSHKMNIGTNPLFAWNKKPDMRRMEFIPEKKAGNILLTIDIPNDKLTFTDFQDWHLVLNKGYLPKNDSELELMDVYDWENEEHQEAIMKSWDKIFDVDKSSDVQVTFEKLELEHILNVRAFN